LVFVAASTDVVIGDPDAQHVLIRPLSRRHPGLFDHRDANWIECEFRIAAGPFRGDIRADLRSEELSTFLDELQALASTREGLAGLTPMEGQFAMTLAGDGRERVQASGEVVSEANRLQFRFELDAAILPSVCEALARVLSAFPVVAAPEV
jgi:hypothetical protein